MTSINIDFEDLLHKISDGGGSNVRCSRVASILASKACRKSIMIGDNLDMNQMKKVGKNIYVSWHYVV